MTNCWPYHRLDELGGTRRPALKAGPFGSAVTKDSYVSSGYKVYGQQEVVSRNINAEKYYISADSYRKHKSCAVEPGDVLITMMGTVGRTLVVPKRAEPGIINPRLMRISLDARRIDPLFMRTFLDAPATQRLLARRAHGGTMDGLNAEALGSIRIPVPPLPEQRKIAEILRTWDEAIEKLEALRAAKQRRQSRLADDLLFGRRRLGCRSPWRSRRLADVTEELTDRNTSLSLDRSTVMGVTNARGIVPMRDQTIGADLARYKILPPKAFAYNPMRINVGSIAMSPFDGDVLVSPDYVLFRCIEGGLDPDFLDHLRGTHWWSHHINAGGSGSVRMRTYYDDLAALRLDLPKYDEQLAIARVLNTGRQEIALVEAEIEAITRQKRGLMQKLLTGEWRVQC